ncbi:MAG: T9SS type A sorting domain-containing protein [Bacteroidota bacterium]
MKVAVTAFILICSMCTCYAQFTGGTGSGHAGRIIVSSVCSYANSNPFKGGNADGEANLRQINSACSYASSNPFAGGDADGHSSLRLTNVSCTTPSSNPYTGGVADGHSDAVLTNISCSITSTNPFAGGDADGHANSGITNSVCSITSTNPFAGGNADGHSNSGYINTVCTVTSTNPFAGGMADGHSNKRITNISCPVTTMSPFFGGVADGHAAIAMINSVCSTTNSSPFYGGRNNLYTSKFNLVCGGTLPVELLSFHAQPEGEKVAVTWSTATEINNDYYSVEKSKDGNWFSQFDKVRGAGNSNRIIYYKSYDYNPYTGDSYYRLKQTDYNGDYKYSNTVRVSIDDELTCRIYPNPCFGEKVIVMLSGKKKERLEITLFDSNGMVVYNSHEIFERDGESGFPINPGSRLQSGVYMVVINTDAKSINKKLVVE